MYLNESSDVDVSGEGLELLCEQRDLLHEVVYLGDGKTLVVSE